MIKQIELFNPHLKQREVLDSLLDNNVFSTIAIIGRQWGKSLLAENIAIYWALNDPGCTVFFVSPTDSQNLRMYNEIIESIIGSGCIKSKRMPRGGIEISFTNKSKILFRSAAAEDSLRGQPVEYMILDEAAFIKKETVEVILLPMLSSRGKKIYISSTPKGKNWVYEWFLKGKIEPSIQEGQIFKSFRFSSYDSPYCNKDMIQTFREVFSPKMFEQEIEAEFVDSSSVFNNLQEVMILEKQLIPVFGEDYYGGIDIGLTILNKDGDCVMYYRWEKLESPELIQEIIKINNIWKFKSIFIENNNQGLTIYQELKRHIRNISDFNTNMSTKPEIINNLIHAFNMKEIKIIKDEYLRIELEAFIFKQKDGKIKFLADNGFHDDCVMALAIARECYLVSRKKIFNPKTGGIFTFKG